MIDKTRKIKFRNKIKQNENKKMKEQNKEIIRLVQMKTNIVEKINRIATTYVLN